MKIRFWFSIFLDDGQGSAYGAASGVVNMNETPVVGQKICIFDFFCSSSSQSLDLEFFRFVEETLCDQRVMSLTTKNEVEDIWACELSDIVLPDRVAANSACRAFECFGFDCDVW